jgi:hypothetical protein
MKLTVALRNVVCVPIRALPAVPSAIKGTYTQIQLLSQILVKGCRWAKLILALEPNERLQFLHNQKQ